MSCNLASLKTRKRKGSTTKENPKYPKKNRSGSNDEGKGSNLSKLGDKVCAFYWIIHMVYEEPQVCSSLNFGSNYFINKFKSKLL